MLIDAVRNLDSRLVKVEKVLSLIKVCCRKQAVGWKKNTLFRDAASITSLLLKTHLVSEKTQEPCFIINSFGMLSSVLIDG